MALLGGKNRGDSEQVESSSTHSPVCMCRVRVNRGTREGSKGQPGAEHTGQRCPHSSQAVLMYQQFQRKEQGC